MPNPTPEALTGRRGGSAFVDRAVAVAAVELLLPDRKSVV